MSFGADVGFLSQLVGPSRYLSLPGEVLRLPSDHPLVGADVEWTFDEADVLGGPVKERLVLRR